MSEDDVFHVMMRGSDHQPMFWDDEDRIKLLVLKKEIMARFEGKVKGFCLMTTHTHDLFKCKKIQEMSTMLHNAYSGYLAKKYGLKKPLDFPLKIIPKSVISWQMDNLCYILNNAVMAGLCKSAGGYKWNSYLFYTRRSTVLSQYIDVDVSLVKDCYPDLEDFKIMLAKKLDYEREMAVVDKGGFGATWTRD